MSIERRIAALAEQFAKDVLAELRTMNLDELVNTLASTPRRPVRSAPAPVALASEPRVKRAKGERLQRRSADELQAALDKVVGALGAGPLRAEALQKALGFDRKELPAVLKLGLESKVLAKKGEKRATTYSVK